MKELFGRVGVFFKDHKESIVKVGAVVVGSVVGIIVVAAGLSKTQQNLQEFEEIGPEEVATTEEL